MPGRVRGRDRPRRGQRKHPRGDDIPAVWPRPTIAPVGVTSDRCAPRGRHAVGPLVRRAGVFVIALGASLFVMGLLAPSAFAHATLSSSDPADGARLSEAPDRIALEFTEPVGLANGYLRVTDQDGSRIDDGSAQADGTRVSLGLGDDVADGSYLISYRLISADSHPIAGALAFVVGDGPLIPAFDGAEDSASDPIVSGLFDVVRWLSYVGLLLLAGPLVVAWRCWPEAFETRIVARLFRIGIGMSVGTAVLSLVTQALYVSGLPLTQIGSIDVPALVGTTYGVALLARLGLLLALAMLVSRIRPTHTGAGWPLAAGGLLVGIALTFSLAGHPIASTVPVLSVVSDLIHVLAMSIWLGGLVVLLAALLPSQDVGLFARVLPRFSTLALGSVIALLISGTVQAVVQISPLAALWSTTYGLLVALKVVGFAVLVYIGNLARTWVRDRYHVETAELDDVPVEEGPVEDGSVGGVTVADRRRSDASRTAVQGLRLSLLLEVAVGAMVLVLAAVLVATVPARSAYGEPFAQTYPVSNGSVDVTVTPAQRGPNVVHVYVLDVAGEPLEVQDLFGAAELASQGIGPIEIPLQLLSPGHYTADALDLPAAGLWELTFSIRFADADPASVTAEVLVT